MHVPYDLELKSTHYQVLSNVTPYFDHGLDSITMKKSSFVIGLLPHLTAKVIEVVPELKREGKGENNIIQDINGV